MGVLGAAIGVLILVGIGFIFLNQISALATDAVGFWNQSTRDNDSKIPKPSPNTTVYDMVIKFEPKWKSVYRFNANDNLLFLNQEGGTISCIWTNQHKASSTGVINLFAVLDFFGKRLENDDVPKGEIVVPAPNLFGETVTLSFTLVDKTTGKKLDLPHHQNIVYKIPSGVEQFKIKETLVYRDLEKEAYQLWITPIDNDSRFTDHDYAEPYKQNLSCSG